MEFERAIFRIHQRTLQSEAVRQARFHAEKCLPWMVLILTISLTLLHAGYVGHASCLQPALKRASLWNETKDAPSLPEDALLGLFVVAGDELLGIRLHMGTGFKASAHGENTSLVNDTGQMSPARIDPDPMNIVASYKFAFDREIILMRPAVFESHQFTVHNISVSERCLAPSWILGEAFRLFDAFDGIVINELAYTFRSRGYLKRMAGAAALESWAWSAEQVEATNPRQRRPVVASLFRKVLLALKSVITFILISAITGFFIRVAVNGSAVLMFPIAIAAQSMGSGSSRMSMSALTRSFPWIGIHVEVLRRAGRPLWPLFRSHLIFLFVQSFAYLSCNLAWRFILYRKSSPEGFEERVFSLCSILELFNLIFVRSANSAAVFPKLSFACMVYLHFYIFCSLYPFHTLALATCAATCAYVMVYCLNHFEEPALRADPFNHTTPTAAHPRALYMPQLSPAWSLEAAPFWTMFYPPGPPSSYPEEAMRRVSDEEYLMA